MYVHISPVIERTVRSTFKKYFQLFWKQLAVSRFTPPPPVSTMPTTVSWSHLSSQAVYSHLPVLPACHVHPGLPVKLSVSYVLFLFRSFLCAFFSLYKTVSKWYITTSNQIASCSLWMPPWYPIIYLNPITISLEIVSDHIDWGLKTKRLPTHPHPHTYFRCQS